MRDALLILMAGTTCLATSVSSALVAYVVLSTPNQPARTESTTINFPSAWMSADRRDARNLSFSCKGEWTNFLSVDASTHTINPLTLHIAPPVDEPCDEGESSMGPDGVALVNGRPVGCYNLERCGWIDFLPDHLHYRSTSRIEFPGITSSHLRASPGAAPYDIGAAEIPTRKAALDRVERARAARSSFSDGLGSALFAAPFTYDLVAPIRSLAMFASRGLLDDVGRFDHLALDRSQDFFSASQILPETAEHYRRMAQRAASRNAEYESAQRRAEDATWFEGVKRSANKEYDPQKRVLDYHSKTDDFRWTQQTDGTFELPAEHKSLEGSS